MTAAKCAGTVLAGPDEGKSLDSMTRPQCESPLWPLLPETTPRVRGSWKPISTAGLPDGVRQRRTSWRPRGSRNTRRGLGTMSKDEAYEVLGLPKGASEEEVVRSHRSLMKKLHPDHGGSTDLAARVNEAKDVLIRRHQQA